MLIFDAHHDIAYNAVNYQRNFREDLQAIRQREFGTNHTLENGTATVTLAEMLKAEVNLIFATLFVNPAWGDFGRLYHSYEEAHEQGLEQLEVYRELFTHPQIKHIKTRADLDAVRATWHLPKEQRTLGVTLLMEGADPILFPEQFSQWYEWGVRAVGLAWSKTKYSGGTVYKGIGAGGLTEDGRELLKVMRKHNAILDYSHMSEEAFYQSLEVWDGLVMASHSNPRSFRDTGRHLTEDMIKQIAARDGVIGLVPYTLFLHQDIEYAKVKSNTPLMRYIEAIDTVCQITGNANHAGIGSDSDGGFGVERIPAEIDTIADFKLIPEALAQKGYSDTDIEKICHGNFMRVLENCLEEG
jgi:membrane dipeptidase